MSLRKFSTAWLNLLRLKLPLASVAMSGTVIDWSAGDIFTKSISANTTFTFSNASNGQIIVFNVRNTSGGPLTIVLPTGMYRADPLNLTVLAGKENTYTFMKSHGNIYAIGYYDAQPLIGIGPVMGYAVFLGYPSNTSNLKMEYFTMSTGGASADFGFLTKPLAGFASFSKSTKGFVIGGYDQSNSIGSRDIQQFGLSAPNSVSDYGDVSIIAYQAGGASNDTRGIFYFIPVSVSSAADFHVEYLTLATKSNSANYGTRESTRTDSRAVSIQTKMLLFRGVLYSGGSYTEPSTQKIEQYVFATLASQSNFANENVLGGGVSATGDNDRIILVGGYNNASTAEINSIRYMSVASYAGITNFGNLANVSSFGGATSNKVKAVFAETGSSTQEVRQVTIATLGNSTAFGTLNPPTNRVAVSDSHGGLA